jgi:uncharacterized protein YcfJ
VSRPEKRCWTETEYRTETRGSDYGGTIIGTIAGGILGNQVGKGNGKTIATAVGAATGAIVGDRLGDRSTTTRAVPVQVERCATETQWEQRVTGYDVTYRYGGKDYTTFMLRDPGQYVRIKISVEVAERW